MVLLVSHADILTHTPIKQLDSSYTWVNNFPSESLGFLLADAGYDVWLSNNRGNVYSTPPSPPDSFWDFTYDEMAGNYYCCYALFLHLSHHTSRYVAAWC